MRSTLLVFAFCFLLPNFSNGKTEVHYGGDENVDACSAFAEVARLSVGPDGFLAVKDDPNLKAVRVDKIYNGQKLWICDSSADGMWLGIVYSKDPALGCKVTHAEKQKKPYRGPCKSGWVSARYVQVLAE